MTCTNKQYEYKIRKKKIVACEFHLSFMLLVLRRNFDSKVAMALRVLSGKHNHYKSQLNVASSAGEPGADPVAEDEGGKEAKKEWGKGGRISEALKEMKKTEQAARVRLDPIDVDGFLKSL